MIKVEFRVGQFVRVTDIDSPWVGRRGWVVKVVWAELSKLWMYHIELSYKPHNFEVFFGYELELSSI